MQILRLQRSLLPSAWNNIALIMCNKADLDGLSMDNLSKGQSNFLQPMLDKSCFPSFSIKSNIPLELGMKISALDTDDLEEVDLKWQVAMLTMRGNRNGDVPRRIVPVETPANALVVQDGIGGYDWSFQTEERPTDFALMSHLSSGSSSSDSKVSTYSKACLKSYESLKEHFDKQKERVKKSNLEIIGYQLGIESLEARIIVHKKNEAVYEKDIAFLKYDVKLTKLINGQISVNNKSGVCFDSQMNENELHDCHLNKSKVFESASDSSVNEIEEENNQVNDRFKKVEGYHTVPPPYTGNYMSSRPDLSFAGLDDSVYKTNVSETIFSVSRIESTTSKSSKDSLEQPKDVRPSAPCLVLKDFIDS
ncbi:hypothetical protein Tco_0223986 [Tanacetum coccineum]